MKQISAALLASYAQQATTICVCLKVTRRDAVVMGFTTLDKMITVNGLDYEPGFTSSSLSSAEALSVDNLELTIIPDESLPAADLLAGLWNYAAFELFEVDYTTVDDSPGPALNVLKRGNLGEVNLRRGQFVAEFRSLTQALQQTQGIVTEKTCRARLGDSKCTKNLAAFTVNGSVTAVTNTRTFTDSARTQAAGWFADGKLTFTTGLNAGYSQKVKSFTAGVYELSLPMPFAVQVGNAYTVIAGCRKRLAEDCRDKFANVVNFQGEPHLPGLDALSRPGTATDQVPGVPPPNLPPEEP